MLDAGGRQLFLSLHDGVLRADRSLAAGKFKPLATDSGQFEYL